MSHVKVLERTERFSKGFQFSLLESFEIKIWTLSIIIVEQLRDQSSGMHLCTNPCIGTGLSLWVYFEDMCLH